MARGPWRWCPTPRSSRSFFFNDTATTEIYTLSLHDALPISLELDAARARGRRRRDGRAHHAAAAGPGELHGDRDLGAVGIFHELSVDVQDELLDRGVHLHRPELQLDARRASTAAEEDVADDLRPLELCERRRLPHGRVFEAPGLL